MCCCVVFKKAATANNSIDMQTLKNIYTSATVLIKRMRRIALRKQSLHGKIAGSVLSKLFISGNERRHSIDAPSA